MVPADEDILGALDRIVREQRNGLGRLARGEGLRAEEAFDCVHDAFCTFLRMAQEGTLPEDATKHPSMLATMVRNAARNRRRRHHLARVHEAIDAIEPGADGPSVESLVAHAEECMRLRSCVRRLCGTHRTVVMMRLLQERDGEDVALAMGLTRGHVDVLLHRAKASLKACMTEEEEPVESHDGEPLPPGATRPA